MLLKDFLNVCTDEFIISCDGKILCSSVNLELPEKYDFYLDCYIKYVRSDYHVFYEKFGDVSCIRIEVIL